MATNDLYRLVINCTYQGVIVNHVLYFRAKSVGLTAQLLATGIQTDITALLQATAVSTFTIYGLNTFKVSDASGEQGQYLYSPPRNGVAAGEGVPKILAAVYSLRTPSYGRRKRGRLYRTGFPLSYLINGELSSAALTALNTPMLSFLNKYKAGGTSPSWEVGVYSKATGGYNIPFSLAGFTGYTYHQLSTAPGTERGRKA